MNSASPASFKTYKNRGFQRPGSDDRDLLDDLSHGPVRDCAKLEVNIHRKHRRRMNSMAQIPSCLFAVGSKWMHLDEATMPGPVLRET